MQNINRMGYENQRSNCTFMELKYGESVMTAKATSSSNCTFMELKYARRNNRGGG